MHVRATIIATNHTFGNFIGITIIRNVDIVKPPVVASLLSCQALIRGKPPVVASIRSWQASGCGTTLRTRRLLAPGAAQRTRPRRTQAHKVLPPPLRSNGSRLPARRVPSDDLRSNG